MVCNGHYHTPILPKYEGQDIYKGRQIHSHDYRYPDPFEGKNPVKTYFQDIFNLFTIY